MNSEAPQFPITVQWQGGDQDTYDNADELASSLEWFDSESTEDDSLVAVVDARGRRVVLVVEKLEIVDFRLA